jgi:LysR family glycine cleavage system transcriptional activator
MSSRLPPLNLLRGFEAAARHLSFTRAAEELHVTQAAISHQIKLLEADLGVLLFQRMIRKLRLTDAGRVLLPVIQTAFEEIAETVSELRAKEGDHSLTVGLEPSFGANWMSPRLGRFWAQHPGVDLRLHHSVQKAQFVREDLDLAVRWGNDDWPNLVTERLMGLAFTPVCSPDLLERSAPLLVPSDLSRHTLLHDYDREGWREWLASSKASGVRPDSGVVIDDTNVLTQAAIDGQGVALCGLALVANHLEAGRLVRPFEHTIATESAYYVIYPPTAIKQPSIREFINWLHDEAALDQQVKEY